MKEIIEMSDKKASLRSDVLNTLEFVKIENALFFTLWGVRDLAKDECFTTMEQYNITQDYPNTFQEAIGYLKSAEMLIASAQNIIVDKVRNLSLKEIEGLDLRLKALSVEDDN